MDRGEVLASYTVIPDARGLIDAYRPLGVREVWFWRSGAISVFALRESGYVESAASEILPGIDLSQLARFIGIKPMTRAVTEYRAALRAGRIGCATDSGRFVLFLGKARKDFLEL